MMKIWLTAVMVVLALITVDITVRIGWDRFSSGIGSLVDQYWYVKQVSPNTAQSRMTEGPRQPVPVAAPYAVAGAPEGWYAFDKDMQQCELQEAASGRSLGGPAEWMALSDRLGEHYRMEDVTERGQVVQTTMHRQDTGGLTEWVITWYRGKARCEQVQRTKREAQDQRREKYR